MESRYPKHNVDLGEFRKFDPPVATGIRRYVIGQFVAGLGAALAISVIFALSGLRAALVPVLLLWALLYTVGLLNEGRDYAVRAEVVRLLAVMPLGGIALALDSSLGATPVSIAVAVGAYVVASIGALYLAVKEE